MGSAIPSPRQRSPARNGAYSFSGLAPGIYSLSETAPAGYVVENPNVGSSTGTASPAIVTGINLTSGQAATNYNFAEYQPGSISGIKYIDANGSDVYQSSDAGLGGVTITLTGTTGSGSAVDLTTTTASNGSYSFTALAPGVYTVTETVPAGYTPENGDVGSLGGTAGTAQIGNITVTSGETGTSYNFAEYQTGSISGIKYVDPTASDTYLATDAGLAGVTITLTGTTGAGSAVDLTTTTASNGSYSFAGLAPGIYMLTVTEPAGYTGEKANVGSLGGTAGTGVVSSITLGSGSAGVNYDFGDVPPQNSSISGIKYIDANGSDVYQSSDAGLGGVTITLTGTTSTGGAVDLTTTTASNGAYSFTSLAAGIYTVTETVPAGYTPENGDVGSAGGTAGTAQISNITLTAGAAGTAYDFAEYQASCISGIKYIDASGCDVYKSSDAGLGGVTITLTGTTGSGAAVDLTTTTASNGSYSFTSLAPGLYTVTETVPAGYTPENANVGSLGGTAGIALISHIAVTSGETGTGYDLAEYQASSISGTAYNDLNGNDVDNSEPGLAGVTVTLTGTNGLGNPVTLTTTTAANGTYSFTGLAPGSYTVTETLPAGYTAEAGDVGSLGGTAGTEKVSTVTVTSGEAGTNYNFGQYLPGSIAGTVYVDNNSNDTFDAGDTGLSGVTVTLTGTNGAGNSVSATTTTASNGTYSFTGLAPGTYTVTETQPAGYTGETANAGTLGGTAAVGAVSSVMVVSAGSGLNYNFGEIVPLTDSISGTVYKDLTGNGLTSDDTDLSGVTVQLYKDVNGDGIYDTGDTLYATTTSAANGTYSFTNVPPGKYIVVEVTPSGYIETAPTLPDYYGISVAAGQKVTGLNFDNYQESNCMPTCFSFQLSGGGCATTTVTDLRGATAQGETVTVTFTVPTGAPMTYTLVSYNAPDPVFNASDASEQTEFQVATGTYSSGTHTLTVTIPNNYYQIDFVCGAAINQLGPAGSNIFYSAQNRLISADNAGLHDDVDDESATMLFWSSLGQTLIKDFGGSTSTTLGNWLATTYPNLFGGSILGNKTAETVATKYMSYYDVSGQKNNAQVMATALNIYSSTLGLGGAPGSPSDSSRQPMAWAMQRSTLEPTAPRSAWRIIPRSASPR